MHLFARHPGWTTRKRRHTPLRTSIDLSALLSVLLALAFLVMFGNMYRTYPRSQSLAVSVTQHSAWQPGAEREDAVIVAIRQDGHVYLGGTRMLPADLPSAIREAARNSAAKIVYVKADARAKYGDVKSVIDQIRLSGLRNITFLADHPGAASSP